MTTYETVFITLPSLTDQEETDLVASLAQVVADDGGTMVANERVGRRRLAYPVRKFEDGVYTRFLYDASAAVPRELDRRIRLSDKVLRHLTVRLEPDWAEAAKEQAIRDAEAREEAARVAAIAAKEAEEAEARKQAEAEAEGAAGDGADESSGETGEPVPGALAEAPDETPEDTPAAEPSEDHEAVTRKATDDGDDA